MSKFAIVRIGLLVGVLGSLLTGCGSSESPQESTPSAAELTEKLTGCPDDYESWSAALEAANTEKTLPQLREAVKSLACAEDWKSPWVVGETYFRAFDFAASAESLEQAFDRATQSNSERGIALANYRLGWIDFTRGNYDESERRSRLALESFERLSMDKEFTFTWNNLAIALLEKGDLSGALAAMQETREGLARLGLDSAHRRFSQNQALMQIFLGDSSSPQTELESLYEEATAAEDDLLAASAALALGSLHRMQGQLDDATTWYTRGHGEAHDFHELSLLGRGRVAFDRRDWANASRLLKEALDVAASKQSGHELIIASFEAAARHQAKQADATADLIDVIRRADEQESSYPAWVGRWLMAEHVSSDRSERIKFLREAVERLEEQSSKLNPSAEGLRFLRERIEPYAALAREVSRRSQAEAWDVSNRAHARALRSTSLGDEGIEPTSLSDLRQTIPPKTLVISYIFGTNGGLAIGVDDKQIGSSRMPPWSQISPQIEAYRAALVRPLRVAESRAHPMKDLERDLPEARKLAKTLLGAFGRQIERAERIYIVPDRSLALVPFAALPTSIEPLEFLGQTKQIAVLPVGGIPRSLDGPRTPVLVAGDPTFDVGSNFSPLSRASAEIETIQKLWNDDSLRVLSGDQLTPSAVVEQPLDSFRTIHFATHALASTRDPRRCAIFCSRDERLGVDRIAELPLKDALVVLSACRTGQGEVVPGEGVVGLGWAFLKAGAAGVVTSLWQVEDEAASDLMVAFHESLRDGNDAVEALTSAQQRVAQEHPHPAYWAPFVAVTAP